MNLRIDIIGHNPWQNRIVGEGKVAPDQLFANPFNFRAHPGPQQEAASGSLDTLGWIQRVIVNKNTGHLVDGHLRVQLALRYGEAVVPVLYVDLTEDEERLALLMLDTIAAMAITDKEKLTELLHLVQSDDARVQTMLSSMAEKEQLFSDMPEFTEYDEGIEDDVEYNECPKCGHRWPK